MTPERYARLAELFARALDASGPRREALIAEVGAADAELADQLADLLALDARSGDDPAGLWCEESRSTAYADDEPRVPRAAPPPPEIPGYVVGAAIGRGGMATVYAAQQDAPRRAVAIKILRATSQAALRRFATEAAVLARLDHPGIPRVIAFGQHGARPYLILEHVDGERIDVHARRSTSGTRARIRLLAAVCDAVHHAHVRGVVHRDLKPGNILVRTDGRVAVIDFGIARVADPAAIVATSEGELVGTPAYMSPEQAELRPHQVDARSDVYALGVVGFELLTGELPYDLANRTIPEIARIIADQPPRPASALVPGLRGDVEAILARALAKDPDDRYPSAASLADDLRRYLRHAGVSVRTPGVFERLARFSRRKPALTASLAILAAVVMVAAAAITTLWLRATRARDESDAHAERLALLAARLTLDTDPTLALARLREIRGARLDADEVATVLDDATSIGVAADVLTGAHDEVRWAEPFPDAGLVASGGYEGRAVIWDRAARTGRVIAAGGATVRAVRPSPDGGDLLVLGDGGHVAIVDVGGVLRASCPGHRADVRRGAWARDGSRVATGDESGTVRLCSRDGVHRELGKANAPIEALVFSEDGRAILTGDASGALSRWSLHDEAVAQVEGAHRGEILAVAEDGNGVVSIGEDGAVRWWRLDGGRLVDDRRVDFGEAEEAALAVHARAAVIATSAGDVWRAAPERVLVHRHAAPIGAVAISGDGSVVASGDEDGHVLVRDERSGRRFQLRGHAQRIRHLALSPDGAILVSAAADQVRVWDLRRVRPRTGVDAPVVALQRADDAVIVTDATGAVHRWSPTRGRLEPAGTPAPRPDGVLAIAPLDGGAILIGREDGSVLGVGGAGGPRLLARLEDDVRHVACTQAICAAAGDDGVVVASARISPGLPSALEPIARHATRVVALGIASDAPLACSAAADGSLVCATPIAGVTLTRSLRSRAPIAVLVHARGLEVIGADGIVERWRDRAAEPVVVRIPAGATTAIQLGDGRLAVGFADGSLRTYGPSGQRLGDLAAAIEAVTSARLDADQLAAWPVAP